MLPKHLPTSTAIGSTLLIALSLLHSGCASTGGTYKGSKGHTERGYASWYGPGFHGKTAADGSTYDMHELTAAHRTLPFDTVVQVRNRDNGRRVQVRITDRGPFVRGRIIDLSYEAAKQIDMIGPGVAPVEIRVLEGGPDRGRTSKFWVQVGAFRDSDEARAFYREIRKEFSNVKLSTDGTWHRIRLGPFGRRKNAERTQRRLESLGIDGFLTQL